MSTAAVWLFWSSIAFLFYAYGGFALLVGFVGLVRRRRVRKLPITPSVTLIIAAYNEEEVIAERLDNALAMDYPRERLQILVASDGSTDGTDDIVARVSKMFEVEGTAHGEIEACVQSLLKEGLVLSRSK